MNISKVGVVGMDAVTSLGTSWAETKRRLRDGDTGPEPETVHGQPTRVGRVDTPPPENDSTPRYHQLARMALVNLIERWETFPDRPLGLVAATSKGGLGKFDVSSVMDLHNPGIWAGQLSTAFPEVARVSSPNTACATGLTALIQASRWIAHGEIDHALVVTAESCFEPLLLGGYRNMKALCDERGMKPFHPERDGFALSEGAAVMYLWGDQLIESHPSQVSGYVTGWGETNDAHHITNLHPEGRGLNHAIDRCLETRSITRDEVDLLHAHLTTTPSNDDVEKQIINEWPGEPSLQGIKPALGHSIGASGLIEAIATVDVIDGEAPFPLSNCREKDRPVTGTRSEQFQRGLTWNMGFGGHNAVALIESGTGEQGDANDSTPP